MMFVLFKRMLFSPSGGHCQTQEGTVTATRTLIPDHTSPLGSPGCLALLLGILQSSLSTAVFTVVPKENVAQKPNYWINTRKHDPPVFCVLFFFFI